MEMMASNSGYTKQNKLELCKAGATWAAWAHA